MNITDDRKELFKAISIAQGEFTTVSKNAVNPHFKSKFAPLDSIIEMIRPILPKHGLSVMQLTDISPDSVGVIIETIIAHESGQYISSKMFMPVVKNDPQGYGSSISYCRRYGLAAALGIVSDEDVDGNGSGGQTTTKPAAQQSKPAPEKITVDQAICLRDLLAEGKEYTEKTFLAEAKINRLEDLLASRYDGAFRHIGAQIAKEAVPA